MKGNMYTFKEFLLFEKNLHQLHLEQYALRGVYSLRKAQEILLDLRNQFYGSSGYTAQNGVTTKFDGSPAAIVGIDPADKQFFVATKAAFSKNPKLAKSIQQIDELYNEGPGDKLKLALQYLKPLIKEGVWQGDFLYDKNSLASNEIDGTTYHTFRPNTITYAVPSKSVLGKRIAASQFGIVFHTQYIGETLADSKPQFQGIDLSSKSSKSVVILAPTINDETGTLNFTDHEYNEVSKLLSDIGKKARNLDHEFYEMFEDNNLEQFEVYMNSKVREGGFDSVSVDDYVAWLQKYYEEKVYPKVKRQEPKQLELKSKIEWIQKNKQSMETLIAVYFDLMKAKQLFVKKFDNIENDVKTFIQTDKGFKCTGHEGYCAINDDSIVKLVDRLEFSRNNFNSVKAWTKKE